MLDLYPDKIGELIAASVAHYPVPVEDMPLSKREE